MAINTTLNEPVAWMDKETGQVSRVACYSIPLYTTPQDQADRIAELEKQVKDEWKRGFVASMDAFNESMKKQSEPVAWIPKGMTLAKPKDLTNCIPLYTTPQTKPLSIDEAVNIFESAACKEDYKMKEGIQAVLDAIEAKVRGEK
jgi:hypothetical protein